MTGDRTRWGDPPDQGPDGPLNDALDQLESMLDPGRGSSAEMDPVVEASPQPAGDEGYSIPLLEDVVVPGTAPEAATGEGTRTAGSSGDSRACDDRVTTLDDLHCQRMVAERLASEIEVIVGARIEAAVQQASEEIRRQVMQHIQIMLPEILADLTPERGKSND